MEKATGNHSIIFLKNPWKFTENTENEYMENAVGIHSTIFPKDLWQFADNKKGICGEDNEQSLQYLSPKCKVIHK